MDSLTNAIRAGFTGIYVETADELRLKASLKGLVAEMKMSLWCWSSGALQRLHPPAAENAEELSKSIQVSAQAEELDAGEVKKRLLATGFYPCTATEALDLAASWPERVLWLPDLPQFWQDNRDPLLVRSVREAVFAGRSAEGAPESTSGQIEYTAKPIKGMCHVVISYPLLMLPPSIETTLHVISIPAPSAEELNRCFTSFTKTNSLKVKPEIAVAAKETLTGLSLWEVEDALAISAVEAAKGEPFSLAALRKFKEDAVRKGGILEWWEPPAEGLSGIGGFDAVKEWLAERKGALSEAGRKFGLPPLKGVLMTGCPGCLHGDTTIYDPVDGSEFTVRQRFLLGKKFHVLSRRQQDGSHVIADADAPHQYPDAHMIKLTLSDGSSITVTDHHRIWSGMKWIHANDVWDTLSRVKGICVPSPYKDGEVLVNVVGAEDAGTHPYYDFHVPVYENYAACGMWHHNTGKSLFAKSVASQWGFPLLRLSLGRVFSKFVGDSEARIRAALALADRVAPIVLWVDEIEKELGGLGASGSLDSGVSARVLSTLLNWLQERGKDASARPVFVVATANRIDRLTASNPEFIRKGRWDEVFFSDLPTLEERIDIFRIHAAKFSPTLSQNEKALRFLADSAKDFSGAEIEGVIHDGMFRAFAAGAPALAPEHVSSAIEVTKPLARMEAEAVGKMREWAKRNARPVRKLDPPPTITGPGPSGRIRR